MNYKTISTQDLLLKVVVLSTILTIAGYGAQAAEKWELTSPLVVAASKGETAKVEDLLNQGAVVNDKNKSGETALTAAAGNGHLETVILLLSRGADIHQSDLFKRTALMRASGEDFFDVMYKNSVRSHERIMKREKVDIDLNELIFANSGNVSIVRLLLSKGARVNEMDSNDSTALMRAVNSDSADVALLLIEKGARLEVKDNMGQAPLHLAAYMGKLEMVALLIENNAVIDYKTMFGKTPLMFAAERNFLDVVKLLLKKGAKINSKDDRGNTALSLAIRSGHGEMVEFLRKSGSKLPSIDSKNILETMINAVMGGDMGLIKEIVSKGVDINRKTEEGWTALLVAANVGNLEAA
ncbi:MAG: ankyrin repeat domain-containing protein, partial [Nitrospinota bacterium]|nr:ankyrin repeat domain-containing protein [Nitrospinota bacterium]